MKNVEDIYPLSPMQELMLLHAMTAPDRDVLFNQFCYDIRGSLDVAAFERAWRKLVERHPTLRTAFVWQDLPQPLQVVRQTVDLPFTILDWKSKHERQQEDDLSRLKAEDLHRGFTPSDAPLMRVTLVQLPNDAHHLIWSSHHLLLDRWCLTVVLDDLVALYEAERRGQPARLRRPSPFRNYIGWIEKQNSRDALAFWSTAMQGFSEPTLITSGLDATAPEAETRYTENLGDDLTAAIRDFARRNELTTSTIFHGAWALLINHYTARQDVVFGTVVAGRPPDLVGVDSMVGSFINNLPMRISLPSDRRLADWLQGIQRHQQDRVPFEYVSLADIQRSSGVAPSIPLFDTILVWLAPVRARHPETLELHELSGGVNTAYPLTVTIQDDERGFELSLSSTLAIDLIEIVQRLRRFLAEVVGAGDHPLARVPGFVRDARGEPTVPLATSEPIRELAGSHPTKATREPSYRGRETEEVEALQALLIGEWASVLDTTVFGIHDNFFDLGGNSLLAARLHGRLEAALGKTIPMMTLFHRATVEHMATVLLRQDWPLHQNIARPLRPGGSKPPVFCVASHEVNTVGYAMLARHLEDDQPVIVLQSPPDTDELERLVPAKIPAVATSYIEAMEPYLSDGPIRLLGMCGGAHLALEMGNQLHARGRVVDFIGLVNTWSVNTLTKLFHVEMARNNLAWYLRRLRGLVRLSPRELLADAKRVAGNRWRLAKDWLSGNRVAVEPDPWHQTRNDRAPAPTKFPGTVTVFRIRKQQFFRPRDPLLGWGEHAERVELCHLPAKEHLAILREPHVRILADEVTARIQNTNTSRAAPQKEPRDALDPVAITSRAVQRPAGR